MKRKIRKAQILALTQIEAHRFRPFIDRAPVFEAFDRRIWRFYRIFDVEERGRNVHYG